ncbi:hypothetical protein M9Y10_039498 [Tritrichomonas musculus]|uniref:DUF3447 domain-containing protein n=1 Tax=Tritrichomonas musculus TaxID=1915356 RepID=A0ABR2KBE1_9EUKA
MDGQVYLDEIKQFQSSLLHYLDEGQNLQNYPNLIKFLKDQFSRKRPKEIKETLRLISKISKNHHRSPNFIDKIDQFLINFKNEIKQTFSNYEIFSIFKNNKRLLLFLLKESILTFDQTIVDQINYNKYWDANYIKFFLPECKPYITENLYNEIEGDIHSSNSDEFEEKRKIGENELQICELIRNDSIDEFIVFVNRTNASLSMKIPSSIFETNRFLYKKSPTLLEYSAFFGSIQIFKFLFLNGIEFTPSLCLYAIHGDNPDIIHHLEENNASISYNDCFIEAIKCFCNDVAYYILNNYLDIQDDLIDSYFP